MCELCVQRLTRPLLWGPALLLTPLLTLLLALLLGPWG